MTNLLLLSLETIFCHVSFLHICCCKSGNDFLSCKLLKHWLFCKTRGRFLSLSYLNTGYFVVQAMAAPKSLYIRAYRRKSAEMCGGVMVWGWREPGTCHETAFALQGHCEGVSFFFSSFCGGTDRNLLGKVYCWS